MKSGEHHVPVASLRGRHFVFKCADKGDIVSGLGQPFEKGIAQDIVAGTADRPDAQYASTPYTAEQSRQKNKRHRKISHDVNHKIKTNR